MIKSYRILITGGQGRLAKELIKSNHIHTLLAPSKDEMDITKPESLDSVVESFNPEIIIHCAALTNPLSVHEEFPVKSIDINIIGTCNIVKSCINKKIKLIYISTDYVYPKNKTDLKETDALLPFNNYGWSKMGGECAVRMHQNHLIIRGSLYPTPFPHDKAFTNIIRNNLYQDQAADLIFKLLEETGVINIGTNEQRSYFELAKETKENVFPAVYEGSDIAKIMILNIDKLNKIL